MSTEPSIALSHMQKDASPQGRPSSSCFWSALEKGQLRWDMVHWLDTSGDTSCLLCLQAFWKAVADHTLKLQFQSDLELLGPVWWIQQHTDGFKFSVWVWTTKMHLWPFVDLAALCNPSTEKELTFHIRLTDFSSLFFLFFPLSQWKNLVTI